jgi:hypothetical protein
MTPEQIAELFMRFPQARTIGDVLQGLDDSAHRAEDTDDWEAAGRIRGMQGELLLSFQVLIDAGVVDVHAAIAPTLGRGEVKRETGDAETDVPGYNPIGLHLNIIRPKALPRRRPPRIGSGNPFRDFLDPPDDGHPPGDEH